MTDLTVPNTNAAHSENLNVLSFPFEVSTGAQENLYRASVGTRNNTIYIDGLPLYQILDDAGTGQVSDLDNAGGLPTAAAFRERYAHATKPFADFFDLQYMGLALASAVGAPFPYHKVPVLTCCSDPLCGYAACTVTVLQDTVTWSGFGTVWPTFATDESESGQDWSFSPLDHDFSCTFDRATYESLFATALQARNQVISREAAAALPGASAWPGSESTRLVDLLRHRDPLHLAAL